MIRWGAALTLGLLLAACGGGSGGGGSAPAPRAHIDFVSSNIQFAGDTWSFDASGSTPATADSTITDYRWDFEYDGTTFAPDALNATPAVDWTYTTPGAFTVALEVVDSSGATDITTQTVQVVDPALGLQVLFVGGGVLDFGSVPVGDPVDRTVFLINNTASPAIVSAGLSLTGISGVTDATGATPANLPAGASLQVTLRFASNDVVAYPSGRIEFVTDKGNAGLYASAQATPGFAPSGTMIKGRKYHTATLLRPSVSYPQGRVLVVGGVNEPSVGSPSELASTEFYDPVTGLFAYGPDMPGSATTRKRAHHTATLVSSGKVLVAGGQYYDSSQGKWVAQDNVLVYDPVLGWNPTPFPLGAPRTQHVAVWTNYYLVGERVLLIGGKANPNSGTDALATVDVLLATGEKQATWPLQHTRVAHAAVWLGADLVLIVGGQDPSDPSGATASAEVVNLLTGDSTAVSGLAPARANLTLSAVYDGAIPSDRIYAIGGSSQSAGTMARVDEFYGISWSVRGALLQTPRSRHRTVELDPGRGLLVVGGLSASSKAVAGAEILSPDGTAVMSAGGTLHTARGFGHQATLLTDGSVLVTGGASPGSPTVKSAERYVPGP